MSIFAAGRSTWAARRVRSRVDTSIRRISVRAQRGRRAVKNSQFHPALSIRFAPKAVANARRSPGSSSRSSVRAEATAISPYSVVHGGPKAAPGGCQAGLSRLRYQRDVTSVPSTPITAVAATAAEVRTSRGGSFISRPSCVLGIHGHGVFSGGDPAPQGGPQADGHEACGLHQDGHPHREHDLSALALETVTDRPAGGVGVDDEWHREVVARREVGADEAGADGDDAYALSGNVDAQGLEQVDLPCLGRAIGPVSYTHLTLPTKRIV